MVARGDIWWYEAPNEKPRPYLILTRDPAIPLLTRVIGVPTTGTARGIPTEVPLGASDGMPADCVLSFDNLQLLRRTLLTRRITTLPAHRWTEVRDALNFTLAC